MKREDDWTDLVLIAVFILVIALIIGYGAFILMFS